MSFGDLVNARNCQGGWNARMACWKDGYPLECVKGSSRMGRVVCQSWCVEDSCSLGVAWSIVGRVSYTWNGHARAWVGARTGWSWHARRGYAVQKLAGAWWWSFEPCMEKETMHVVMNVSCKKKSVGFVKARWQRREMRAIAARPMLLTWWPAKVGWNQAQIGPKVDLKKTWA